MKRLLTFLVTAMIITTTSFAQDGQEIISTDVKQIKVDTYEQELKTKILEGLNVIEINKADSKITNILDYYRDVEETIDPFHRQNKLKWKYSGLLNGKGTYTLTLKNSKEDMGEVDKIIDVFLRENIKEGMTDTQKINAIYKYVTEAFFYDQISSRQLSEENQLKERNILKGLKNENGVVCEAYAMLSQRIFQKAGIENEFVYGTNNTSGEPHIWNKVKVKGKWYHYDATAGDTSGMNFCLVSQEFMLKYMNISPYEQIVLGQVK